MGTSIRLKTRSKGCCPSALFIKILLSRRKLLFLREIKGFFERIQAENPQISDLPVEVSYFTSISASALFTAARSFSIHAGSIWVFIHSMTGPWAACLNCSFSADVGE